ncbi:MAG: zf-TFIIB domain-containing protein [Candidatus Omnitrophica bacterium]|nr:zf-TFIIB domain-containing protein [Candidatus Omnitrophota bacterium]
MNCPKCVGKLEPIVIEGVTVDVCWACEGIWFDQGELEKVIEADSRDFKRIDINRDSLDGEEFNQLHSSLDHKVGQCPKCSGTTFLKKEDYPNGVTVDVCPECLGIWLDGGEILKLRNNSLVKLADKLYSFKSNFIERFQYGLAELGKVFSKKKREK